MPYLKAILVNANDKQRSFLRAKSMECIGLVGMAVGKDKSREDAKQVYKFHYTPMPEILATFIRGVLQCN